MILLELVLVGVVAESTAPAVQVVVHEVVVRLQLLPTFLSEIQLLSIVKIASNREYLVLKFNGLIAEISSLVHFLEMNNLMAFNVELKHLLVEPFAPAPS